MSPALAATANPASSAAAGAMLLVAYQCGPGMGSVSQIGWHWYVGLAARRPVTLVTHVRNRAAIEAAPDRPAQASVIYIDTEWFAGPLYRLAKRLFPRSEHAVFMISQLDWFVFDWVALRQLRKALESTKGRARVDSPPEGGALKAGAPWRLLHLVTPVTVSAPTRLHQLGLPVVRGPLNCGLSTPPGFESVMQDDSVGLARLRVFPRLLEAVFGSLRHSQAVLTATAATRAAIPASARHRAVAMLENAVDPDHFTPTPLPPAPGPGEPLRLSFVGRLVAVKALPLLLRAMHTLRSEGRLTALVVVGDGPMRERWQAEAAALGLADAVQWWGAQGPAEVARALRESHLFCLPSVRESGGAVLLEAMACGRPVIGMNFGGPAEVVDAEVGWKVAMPDEAGAVAGLAVALREACADPAGLAQRGAQARARVLANYTWAAKLDAAEALYQRVAPV